MKKYLLLALSFFSLALISCDKKTDNSNNKIDDFNEKEDKQELSAVEKYYLPIADVSKNDADVFKAELHKLVEQSHTKRLTYKEVWTALEIADQDPDNKNNVLCLYSGLSMPKSNHVGSSGSYG